MSYISVFKNLNKSDVITAGGKGASLGEMTRAGILVPPGFVVLADSFEEFIKLTDLNVEIDHQLHSVDTDKIHTIENASAKIQNRIRKAEMPKEIANKILKSFDKLGEELVAVRSSATSEDSADVSWAGQLDSHMNITRDSLVKTVKSCWASLFTPRAIFYRFEKNLHKETISVAVVVQKMIKSEISGIAFSVHPVTEDHNQIIIEAGWGFGDAVVSSSITPDSYVVEKEPKSILDINVTTQEKELVKKSEDQEPDPEWGEIVWRDVSADKRERQKLTNEQIFELSELVQRIEKHYGFPVDIEWAIETSPNGEAGREHKFYITQSRPITTLSNTVKHKDEDAYNLGNYSDYQRLFQWKGGGLPFLFTDIYMEYYKTLECVCLLSDGVWTNFLPKKIVKQTLDDGLDLIKDNKKFKSYKKRFDDYKKTNNIFFDDLLSKDNITRDDVRQALNLLAGFFVFYSKTEFFYTDKAFEYSKRDKITRDNLAQFDEIKNGGRAYLNSVFLEADSHIEKFLARLVSKFSIEAGDLKAYSMKEILNLFDGKKVDNKIVNGRKKSFILQGVNGATFSTEGKEARKWIDLFYPSEKEFSHSGVLKGVTVNKGKVTGKVKILHYGYEDFSNFSKLVEQMEKGDILVAESTSPELVPACKKASAIITNQGGMMSHAAIVSRELDIPCIVGTGNATDILKDGMEVEVDADEGVVRILSK